MKPLVSILIPAFNAEEWIADTIRSAIAQTWEPKEIVVVDDGSTDRTLQVARRFESDGVRVVTQKNQGAAAARNNAYSLCHGDYVQWLDADDLLSPDKITNQMELVEKLQNGRVLISSGWGSFMYRYYRTKFVATDLWCDLSPVDWLVRKMGQNLHMQTSTWLVSRQLTEAAGPWDNRMHVDDDGEYFCRVLLASQGVRFVPEAKVYYRASGVSSLSYIGHSDKKMEAQLLTMQLHIKYLRSLEDSQRTRTACVQYVQNWLPTFYPNRLDLIEQAKQLAKDAGGQVDLPKLSWKYSWIKALFGWRYAVRAQLYLTRTKWSVVRLWDKAFFRIEHTRMESLKAESGRP